MRYLSNSIENWRSALYHEKVKKNRKKSQTLLSIFSYYILDKPKQKMYNEFN